MNARHEGIQRESDPLRKRHERLVGRHLMGAVSGDEDGKRVSAVSVRANGNEKKPVIIYFENGAPTDPQERDALKNKIERIVITGKPFEEGRTLH